uniref:Protein Vpu n=1 Tax=Human immunodeficiency virus type 1 TaxID=11676 RepID=A0A0A0URP5_HV1|nr:vpu protein [Human immunodeficiency virus 1]
MVQLGYSSSFAALIAPLIIAIVVWTLAYMEHRRLVRQKKIDRLIKRIRERAEDSGHESEGDPDELSTMVDMGRLRLLDVNDL